MNISQHRSRRVCGYALLGLSLLTVGSVANAQEHHPPAGPGAQHGGQRGQAEERWGGPVGYQRMQRPQGIENRPQALSQDYRHNYRADRGYRIGPYSAPRGYNYRRWHYGERLPPAFWASSFIIGDFWLFDLSIPPVGYEWVRYGPDALLIDTTSGEIVQTVYGRFM
jgi:Ni/Co efflux regulator RcnB